METLRSLLYFSTHCLHHHTHALPSSTCSRLLHSTDTGYSGLPHWPQTRRGHLIVYHCTRAFAHCTVVTTAFVLVRAALCLATTLRYAPLLQHLRGGYLLPRTLPCRLPRYIPLHLHCRAAHITPAGCHCRDGSAVVRNAYAPYPPDASAFRTPARAAPPAPVAHLPSACLTLRLYACLYLRAGSPPVPAPYTDAATTPSSTACAARALRACPAGYATQVPGFWCVFGGSDALTRWAW